jgi:hypothetical protein
MQLKQKFLESFLNTKLNSNKDAIKNTNTSLELLWIKL